MIQKSLLEVIDEVLLTDMNQGLKDAIDKCLEKGESPYRILDFIGVKCGCRNTILYCQAWAYLEMKLGGSPIDPTNKPPR